MSSAKEEILKRVRQATEDVPDQEQPDDVPLERSYRQKVEAEQFYKVDMFAERVGEYKATVRRITKDAVKEQVAVSCREQEVENLVIPPGMPEEFLPDEINLLHDGEEQLSHSELDASDGVLTTCRIAVAQTGTIILDGGEGQGRRALTLVPDYHLCIVREDQVVGILPEAIRELEEIVNQEGAPITMISGPSATSDIELSRVEGVHGPRRLEVLIVKG